MQDEVKAQSDSDLEHGGDDVHVRLQILRFTASQILLQAGLGTVLRMMCRQQYRARSGSWDSHCCVSSDSRLAVHTVSSLTLGSAQTAMRVPEAEGGHIVLTAGTELRSSAQLTRSVSRQVPCCGTSTLLRPAQPRLSSVMGGWWWSGPGA